ncbi:hypothetical protein IAI10_17250 [Clostridium sp. 19966]|uniref:hypothetical protein n=1 Tax=Clostridium sp. 19966 TaxID=2768166 RepID=UPI0028DD6BBD|nr:hypothetical protein [Clostridium sp. 19966]MDT8718417.1 hypothetical protein [Clostridium sp. 19966]
MNITQLQKELDNMGMKKRCYSINGNLATDTYILNQVYHKWEYFYFDEKGNKQGDKIFENEDEACRHFLEKMKNEIEYPTSDFK